jgi:signal transduction histidine kinase
VHFDPVESEETSATNLSNLPDDDLTEPETDRRPPAPSPREGLPARFRMRHGRHYVDELLGDAPLRTVREIPISEIEPPIEDDAVLEGLEDSIRRLGVLEPLIVGRRGHHYRVVAGMRRLRVARRIGLGTVPCLVHDVDDEKLAWMREAASERVGSAPPPAVLIEEPVAAAPIEQQPAADASPGSAANDDAPERLDFLAALLPVLNGAGSDRLRWTVLTDLVEVERSGERIAAAAREILARTTVPERALADCASLLSDAIASIATEARLRGVRVETALPDPDAGVSLDSAPCRNSLVGLLHCLLAMAPRSGTVLSVRGEVTSIRPAFIVHCTLREGDVELTPDMLGRFFDAEWHEHPCGQSGAQILAALALTARAHGGRVDAQARPSQGVAVTFVVPRPLTDF